MFLVATVSEVKVAPQHESEVLQSSNLQARQWLFTDLCLPSPKVVTTLHPSLSRVLMVVQQHSELEQLTSSAEHLPLLILTAAVGVVSQGAL